MSRLLDDLLDMSRVTRNVIELKRKRLDLRDLVGEATEMAKPVLTNLQHRLTISTPPNPLWVYGDGTRVVQVIGNLIDNAAKYTEPGGSIEIRLDLAEGNAVMSVRDSGIGLSSEMIPKVFDLFSQVHKSVRVACARRTEEPGLSVVQARLVELRRRRPSRWQARACARVPSTVRVPLATQPRTSAGGNLACTRSCPYFKARPHILVVDDNHDAAQMLAEMLRVEGFPVAVAFDGAGSALIRLREDQACRGAARHGPAGPPRHRGRPSHAAAAQPVPRLRSLRSPAGVGQKTASSPARPGHRSASC